jgi:hypothetical protein
LSRFDLERGERITGDDLAGDRRPLVEERHRLCLVEGLLGEERIDAGSENETGDDGGPVSGVVVSDWEQGPILSPGSAIMPGMDTTSPTKSPIERVARILASLEGADPADVVTPMAEIADLLEAALDSGEPA